MFFALLNQIGFSYFLQFCRCGKPAATHEGDGAWRLRDREGCFEERSIDAEDGSGRQRPSRRPPARSVTVNIAESPLGWLFSRGLVTTAQFDAGERLRLDWERGLLAPHVTMHWDAAPISSRRSGSSAPPDLAASAIDARKRFHSAIEAAGPGLADILWRVVCAGDGMREAETALGWPARAGKLVLTLALDRIAAFYRIG